MVSILEGNDVIDKSTCSHTSQNRVVENWLEELLSMGWPYLFNLKFLPYFNLMPLELLFFYSIGFHPRLLKVILSMNCYIKNSMIYLAWNPLVVNIFAT